MKIKKTTKEIMHGDFKAIIKKLSADDMLEIQSAAVKIKNIDSKLNNANVADYTEIDNKKFRVLRFIKSIVNWNIETEDSTDEVVKHLPIDENSLKVLDNELFTFIEKEINDYNSPSDEQLKN
jgi:hypothetical protein